MPPAGLHLALAATVGTCAVMTTPSAAKLLGSEMGARAELSSPSSSSSVTSAPLEEHEASLAHWAGHSDSVGLGQEHLPS